MMMKLPSRVEAQVVNQKLKKPVLVDEVEIMSLVSRIPSVPLLTISNLFPFSFSIRRAFI